MKPVDIIEKLKITNPELLKGVNEKAAERLLRLVLAELSEEIDSAHDGVIVVPGLGRFRIKTIAAEVDGDDARRRVIFEPWVDGMKKGFVEP
jgi:hypothetical protein